MSVQRVDPELRALFLRRLARLVKIRRSYSEDLNKNGLRLLDRAIDSTHLDCIGQGAAGAAADIHGAAAGAPAMRTTKAPDKRIFCPQARGWEQLTSLKYCPVCHRDIRAHGHAISFANVNRGRGNLLPVRQL